jgi:alpha-aminoadipic semialdehyde synthase
MKALDHILENNIRLIDYEKICDSAGKRLVAFGRFAGLAGMIDFLSGLGIFLFQR